jgi:hypothetical protein
MENVRMATLARSSRSGMANFDRPAIDHRVFLSGRDRPKKKKRLSINKKYIICTGVLHFFITYYYNINSQFNTITLHVF